MFPIDFSVKPINYIYFISWWLWIRRYSTRLVALISGGYEVLNWNNLALNTVKGKEIIMDLKQNGNSSPSWASLPTCPGLLRPSESSTQHNSSVCTSWELSWRTTATNPPWRASWHNAPKCGLPPTLASSLCKTSIHLAVLAERRPSSVTTLNPQPPVWPAALRQALGVHQIPNSGQTNSETVFFPQAIATLNALMHQTIYMR